MQRLLHFLLLSTALIAVSCNRARNAAKEKAKDLADKVLPRFDDAQPDTRFNKKRFQDFLQVELTPDIKNIYCFDEAIGIDASYQFAFNCDTSTVNRIVRSLQLSPAKDKVMGSYAREFPWWNGQHVDSLRMCWHKNAHPFYKTLWYDPQAQKAYYLDYDL